MKTRLNKKLGIEFPVIQAPMALAAGGQLAKAVSESGGFGFIGGAYGDGDWLAHEFLELGNAKNFGCGFITWSLAQKPELLELALTANSKAIFLSFADPAPFMSQIKDAGAFAICQVQTLRDAQHALAVGADIIVAQGAEAGGHGESRGTMSFVAEVANYISSNNFDACLCAAGGIADGRGIVSSLALGADGVVIGSRFWASREALVHPNMHERAIHASGDQTIRSTVMDVARKLKWPSRYNARVLKNNFTDKWHNKIDDLLDVADVESARWMEAWKQGDMDTANTFVGEAAGLINEILPAAKIMQNLKDETRQTIDKLNGL